MSDSSDSERADISRQALVAVALARRGGWLLAAGFALWAASVAFFLLRISGPVALAAVLQTFLFAFQIAIGLHIGLDRDLFADIANAPDLEAFDRAMRALRLMPDAKAGRSMPERVAGLVRLLRRQAICTALQGALFLLPLLIALVSEAAKWTR